MEYGVITWAGRCNKRAVAKRSATVRPTLSLVRPSIRAWINVREELVRSHEKLTDGLMAFAEAPLRGAKHSKGKLLDE
jgi:hypothetical protein